MKQIYRKNKNITLASRRNTRVRSSSGEDRKGMMKEVRKLV